MRKHKKIRLWPEKAEPIGCLEAQRMIEPYLGGKLTYQETCSFIEHIDNCPECREELDVFFTVYQALSLDEQDNNTQMLSLDETLRRTKAHLSRVKTAKKVHNTGVTTILVIAAVLIIGIVFPDTWFSPHNAGIWLRHVFRGEHGNISQTESELPRLESVLGDLVTESELPSEAEVLIMNLETEINAPQLSEPEIDVSDKTDREIQR